MSYELERLIELLTGEFMHIKGWGAEPDRLAPLPILGELAGITPDLVDPVTAGSIILCYLIDSIESLPERQWSFEGKQYPTSTMKTAYYLELRIGTTDSHRRRWYRLMKLLGLRYTYRQWRQPRLERAFLRLLAEHVVRRSNRQTV